jgi:hypothetical protein
MFGRLRRVRVLDQQVQRIVNCSKYLACAGWASIKKILKN